MNWLGWIVWGFAGTVILTTVLAASQALGITRMNIPYMLGTMVTPDRDRAKVLGIALHLLNGWMFSLVYVAAFHLSGLDTWWFGAGIGLVHGAFVLAVAVPALPGLHPRMASEVQGPSNLRPLEPPGFLARNYGGRTPVSVLAGHLVFGIVLGLLYRPVG